MRDSKDSQDREFEGSVSQSLLAEKEALREEVQRLKEEIRTLVLMLDAAQAKPPAFKSPFAHLPDETL